MGSLFVNTVTEGFGLHHSVENPNQMSVDGKIQLIAFYLPQFHPIPENDKWWGKGFTEWTNVAKAKPLFSGHYQPHVPGQLGYYDLRDPDVRSAQAGLAREYGIHGFCYYHYWFNGKRLLGTPFDEVLASGKPDFPFCVCWANENWTRRWDGKEQEVLMTQHHNHEDDLAFIESLIPAFRDERYIRVNGSPLLLIYRSALLPNPVKTSQIWRETMHKAGVGDLYLVRVENIVDSCELSPTSIGFDAAVEFAPHGRYLGGSCHRPLSFLQAAQQVEPDVFDYEKCMLSMLSRTTPDYKLFRGIFPSWDNSARRRYKPGIFIDSSPEKYAFWLSQIAHYTQLNFVGEERLIFVNAWNEWAEGCHLEPDNKYGLRYLEATRNALHLAGDLSAVVGRCGGSTGSLPFNYEKWEQSLASYCADCGHLSEDEIQVLADLGHHHLSINSLQLEAKVQAKDKVIENLHNSLSWRITAPLRKLYNLIK